MKEIEEYKIALMNERIILPGQFPGATNPCDSYLSYLTACSGAFG